MKKIELVVDLDSPAGYSAHARLLIKSLADHGYLNKEVAIKLVNSRKDPQKVELPDGENRLYQKLLANNFEPDVRVRFEPAQFYDFEDNIPTIGFMQWETTSIRRDNSKGPNFNLVEQMNRCVGIITSATSARETYVTSGVTCPIKVVPGPIFEHKDTEELPIEGLTTVNGVPVAKKDRLFSVGYMAQWGPRKNIEAFLEDSLIAFNRSEAVVVLKTYITGAPGEQERLLDRCRSIRDKVNRPNPPKIILITDKLTDQQVQRFFNSIDAYYCPSRGEGYCMPVAFAVAAGKPIITSNYGGQADYLPNDCLIGGTFSPAVGMSTYDCGEYWFEIDRREAIDALHLLKDSPPYRENMGEKAKKYALAKAGSEVFARNFVNAILSILGDTKSIPVATRAPSIPETNEKDGAERQTPQTV